ncbi:Wzz/FepE/Etk N-terminal domain-containing protein [Pseudomonas sp. CR3202]|uniref:Wzz/FepE/Etk N-terminal domain-containing protein n=1 Tax=Pseudomonas sp. CR3202 TaxID=3351532 RepID=UPI003BEFD99A
MNAPVPNRYRSVDEIDLLTLFKLLWRQKILIAACVLGVLITAAAYVVLVTPEYQVQSLLRPAALKDLDELNETKLYELKPQTALKHVGDALESYSLRLRFFQDHPELIAPAKREGESLEQTLERLNRENFSVIRPDPKKTGSFYAGLTLNYPEGMDGVAIVNGLVDAAVEDELAKVREDFTVFSKNRVAQVQGQIAAERASYLAGKEARIASLLEADQLKKEQLQDELQVLRQQLKGRRQDRIRQLDEAIQIATQLGIAKPTTPSALGDSVHAGPGSVIRTEVNNQQIPLYFMGTDALKAERSALLSRDSDDFTEPRVGEIQAQLKLLANNREVEVLKQRENEDLFLSNLAKLRREIARLKGLQVDFNKVQLVRVDQVATVPSKPVKPRKALVLGMALAAGLVLGICAAMIRAMALRSREVEEEQQPAALVGLG